MKTTTNQFTDTIQKAYKAFNERNIDNALSTMQPDIQWSKAWEAVIFQGTRKLKTTGQGNGLK
ncbi:hypothetical protein [Flavobacterium pallidum]|uniref:hypothetical protein n=1 Tax=Flavobacterium pallidum TaxID=2172098 RepID=UPI001FE6E73B|nr:hypothetical protein [Flavobacterium pallidum]